MFLDNLFEIVEKKQDSITIKLCDEKHPLFMAHFPNNPILPGFIHLDMIEHFFHIRFKEIKRAKFLKITKPNDTLTYKKNNNKFQVINANTTVASFIVDYE